MKISQRVYDQIISDLLKRADVLAKESKSILQAVKKIDRIKVYPEPVPVVISPPPPPPPPDTLTVSGTVGTPWLMLSNTSGYPPALTIALGETVVENDVLRVQASASPDFTISLFDVTRPLSAAAIAGTALPPIPQLASITNPAQTWIRTRIERSPLCSQWIMVKHGDTTPPVITATLTGTYPEGALIAVALTADKPIKRWIVHSGEDTRDVEIIGSTLRLLNNAAPVFTSKISYSFFVMAEDYAGNQTIAPVAWTISDVIDMSPSQFGTTASTKSAYLTIQSGGLAARSILANVGAICGVRTLERRVGKCYLEFTITEKPSQPVAVGVAASTIATVNAIAGSGVNPGSSYLSTGTVYSSGAVVATYPTFGQGDVIGIAFDEGTGKIWFAKNGLWAGDPAAWIGGVTVTLAEWFAWTGLFVTATDQRTVTANFGASAFAYPKPTGFGAYA